MKFSLIGKRPLHLLFFPLLFVLNHFFTIVTPRNVFHINIFGYWVVNFVAAIIVCLAISWGIYWVFLLKFNKIKSALFSIIFAFPFFFFQDLFLFFEKLSSVGLRARWILPIFLILLTGIIIRLIKTEKRLLSVNQYLNLTSLFLVIYTACAVLLNYLGNPPKALMDKSVQRNFNCNDQPDVFFFLLDSYTSNKSLQDFFHFDNSLFTHELKARDFAVADQAISSYSRTSYSLSAILNFDQVKNLDQYSAIGYSLKESSVINSFKKANYKIHNYSLFDIADQPAYYHIGPSYTLGFLNGIIESSILNMAFYDIRLKLSMYNTHVEVLSKICNEAKKKDLRPRFFYGHILSPHPPFVIDNKGQRITFFNQPNYSANESAYTNQIQGLNQMMIKSVEEIIKSSPNAIIIIMGDHGYRYLKSPAKEREAYTVFLAYRGPHKEGINSLTKSNGIFKLLSCD